MNYCKKDTIKLDYINGLLPPWKQRMFEKHVNNCTLCTNEIEQLSSIAVQLKNLSKEEERMIERGAASFGADLQTQGTQSFQTVSGKLRFSFIYLLSITLVLVPVVIFLFITIPEGTQTIISSRISSFLASVQTFFGVHSNGEINIFRLILMVISFSSLILIPSIAENIYLLLSRKLNRPLQ